MTTKRTAEAARAINTCGDVCPLNMVKTNFALKDMLPGEVLEVTVDEGEPVINVSRSAKEEGHRIIALERYEGYVKMFIQKGE